jgi:prepilin-type processing-associated H-X9-DG protein
MATSLAEALIVIGLIGMLFGLVAPAVMKARSSALRAECLDRIRGIGLAMLGFHGDHGYFPPRRGGEPEPYNRLSWMVQILPYVGEEALWRESRRAVEVEGDVLRSPPHVGFQTVVRQYLCPEDGRLGRPLTDFQGITAAYTSFIGNDGTSELPRGRHGALGSKLSEIVDGSSHTIMAGERPPPGNLRAGWWYPAYIWYNDRGPNMYLFMTINLSRLHHPDGCGNAPGLGPGRLANPCDSMHYWSLHGGGANFVFCDGSARFLRYSESPLMVALASRDGGETVDLP